MTVSQTSLYTVPNHKPRYHQSAVALKEAALQKCERHLCASKRPTPFPLPDFIPHTGLLFLPGSKKNPLRIHFSTIK